MDKKEFPNGMTIKELKEWIAQFPDKNPNTEEDTEVFIETGVGLSGPVIAAYPLNYSKDDKGESADILLTWIY